MYKTRTDTNKYAFPSRTCVRTHTRMCARICASIFNPNGAHSSTMVRFCCTGRLTHDPTTYKQYVCVCCFLNDSQHRPSVRLNKHARPHALNHVWNITLFHMLHITLILYMQARYSIERASNALMAGICARAAAPPHTHMRRHETDTYAHATLNSKGSSTKPHRLAYYAPCCLPPANNMPTQTIHQYCAL